MLGPRIHRAGFLEGRSPFSASGGFTVDRLDVALEKVRWYADHGFSGIKIYNSMTPDWVKPIAAEAHRLAQHDEAGGGPGDGTSLIRPFAARVSYVHRRFLRKVVEEVHQHVGEGPRHFRR